MKGMANRFGAQAALLAGATLFVIAACGSSVGLNVDPAPSGAGGSDRGGASGAGGGTTVGSAGDWGTTTTEGTGGWTSYTVSTSGGGWYDTVGVGGYGGWAVTTTTVGSGGYAGWGGYGGYGGYGGGVPRCVPGQTGACVCANGASGIQLCLANGTFGPCSCGDIDAGTWEQQQLARLRRGIVGTWSGMQTNPWNSGCETKIQFEASGHYSAHSPGDSCIVFYYGSNDDSPEKTYLLDDVLATGEGQGEIAFWFSPGNVNPGELRHVFLSDDENLLRFEAWKTGYGPLVFTLKRVSR
jgi:hypothetical protein